MENIIYASAHPDDLGGSAGTLLRLKKRYKIHLLDMTRGESGLLGQGVSFDECAAMRAAEEEKVSRLLDADLYFLGERDIVTEAFAGREICERAAELVSQLKPRAMFLHWPLDVHIDHIMCNALMTKALHLAINCGDLTETPEIYYHEHTVQTKGFIPDCFVDVTGVFDQKIAILRTYECQNPNDILVTNKTLDARFRGSRCNVKYAEAFVAFFPERMRRKPTIIDELAAESAAQ